MNVIRIILMAPQMSHNSHTDKVEDWWSEVIGRNFHRGLVRPGWTYPGDSLTMLPAQFRQIAIIRIAQRTPETIGHEIGVMRLGIARSSNTKHVHQPIIPKTECHIHL